MGENERVDFTGLWQPLSNGNYTEITRAHHHLLGQLVREVERLRAENDSLKVMLNKQAVNNGSASKSQLTQKPLFSSLFNDGSKKLSADEINILAGVARECREAEKKEVNVVLFGVNESDGFGEVNNDEADMNTVSEIFKEMNVEGVKIKKVARAKKVRGKEEKEDGKGEEENKKENKENESNVKKPSVVIVQLESVEARDKVLRAARNLRESRFNKVFVREDWTHAQRLAYKKLVELRNKKNEKLNKDENGRFTDGLYYGIRNGAVVEIRRKQTGSVAASTQITE